MKNALIGSLLFHALILGMLSMSVSNLLPRKTSEKPPLIIEFQKIGEKTTAPHLAPIQSPDHHKVVKRAPSPVVAQQQIPHTPQEKKEPLKKDIPDKPDLKPKKLEAIPLKKATAIKPIPKKMPPPPKGDLSQKKPVNLSKKAPNPSKVVTKSAVAQSNLDALLQKMEKESSASNGGAPVETVGDSVTVSELDALRNHIYRFWNINSIIGKNIAVDIRLTLDSKGMIQTAEVMEPHRMKDPNFRLVAESVLRALKDPHCNPLPLPSSKYEQWQTLELSFNPRDIRY